MSVGGIYNIAIAYLRSKQLLLFAFALLNFTRVSFAKVSKAKANSTKKFEKKVKRQTAITAYF